MSSLILIYRNYDNYNNEACVKYAYRTTPFYDVHLWPLENWEYGLPGSNINYSFQGTNRGQVTDTFSIVASGFDWPTVAPTTVGPLAAAESATMDIQVTIPATVTLGFTDMVTITVTSQEDSSKTGRANLTTFAGHVFFMPMVGK